MLHLMFMLYLIPDLPVQFFLLKVLIFSPVSASSTQLIALPYLPHDAVLLKQTFLFLYDLYFSFTAHVSPLLTPWDIWGIL